MERGGRLDLTGMEGYFWNANSREQYTQWCMKRVAYILRLYSQRYDIWEWLGNKVMEDQDTLVVRVVDFWCSIHLAVLGGRIPACETPFGRHHVTRL